MSALSFYWTVRFDSCSRERCRAPLPRYSLLFCLNAFPLSASRLAIPKWWIRKLLASWSLCSMQRLYRPTVVEHLDLQMSFNVSNVKTVLWSCFFLGHFSRRRFLFIDLFDFGVQLLFYTYIHAVLYSISVFIPLRTVRPLEIQGPGFGRFFILLERWGNMCQQMPQH